MKAKIVHTKDCTTITIPNGSQVLQQYLDDSAELYQISLWRGILAAVKNFDPKVEVIGSPE